MATQLNNHLEDCKFDYDVQEQLRSVKEALAAAIGENKEVTEEVKNKVNIFNSIVVTNLCKEIPIKISEFDDDDPRKAQWEKVRDKSKEWLRLRLDDNPDDRPKYLQLEIDEDINRLLSNESSESSSGSSSGSSSEFVRQSDTKMKPFAIGIALVLWIVLGVQTIQVIRDVNKVSKIRKGLYLASCAGLVTFLMVFVGILLFRTNQALRWLTYWTLVWNIVLAIWALREYPPESALYKLSLSIVVIVSLVVVTYLGIRRKLVKSGHLSK
jgi:hypothetical protein